MAYGEPDESGGEQAMTELLGRGRNFTAVASYNDSMAAGAMGVLNDNGIEVPGEISLIGFDDVLVSRYVRPRLTTVRYPIITMGNAGCGAGTGAGRTTPATGYHPPVQPHLSPPSLCRFASRSGRGIAIQMYRFVRVFKRIANVLPAVTFVESRGRQTHRCSS